MDYEMETQDDITPEFARLVLVAALAQAGYDARRGDPLARAWLETDGLTLCDALGVSVDLCGWLRDDCPQSAQLVLGL